MTGVAVADAYRRQGVASTLLQAVDEHASSLRAQYICMFVDSGNPAALSLYSKAGFMLVNYNPLAESFASAIGLYKGPYSGRQYAFVYKRLPANRNARPAFGVLSSPSASSLSSFLVSKPSLLGNENMQPFPSRMPELAQWKNADGYDISEEGLMAAEEVATELMHGGWGEDVAHRWEPWRERKQEVEEAAAKAAGGG